MKKNVQLYTILLFSILLLAIGYSAPTYATIKKEGKVYTIQEVPYTQKKNKYQFVSDPDNYLSKNTIDSINKMCLAIRNKSGAEVAVVVLPGIEPADCFEFSHDLFHYWGIGQKGVDTGLLIVIATEERCAHIYTGYGLEGVLTDVTSGQIFRNEMAPYFQNQEWDNGILAGMQHFYTILHDNEDYEYTDASRSQGDDTTLIYTFLGFFIILFVFSYLVARRQKKCPKCGKHTLQRINSRVINKTSSYITTEETLKCTNCNHILNKQSKNYRNNNHTGPGSGPILGRGFGGGSIGGGFGGGRGGGGGAGGRF